MSRAPRNFRIGSPESRAAARLLAEKRKEDLIPVMSMRIILVADKENSPPPMYVECDPKLIGSGWDCWMTRQEVEAKQREYDEENALKIR
jgi:hypothetical protein